MKRLVRMFHTMRYIRPHQLLARLRLTLRRKWRVRHAGHYRRKLMEEPLPPLRLRDSLPLPVFASRRHLVRTRDGIYTLTFLNESRAFSHPFDWHPRELEYGTRLWLLNLHYMEFLEGLPDDAFVRVVEDWIANVPPYGKGYWLDDWNSYSLSIRCVVWMQQYAVRSKTLPPAFRERMLGSLIRQLRFLEKNLETDIGGNHLIKNIKALLWAGRFWDHEEAERWKRTGEDLLRRELEEQILPDGMHYERSPAYHAQVFADLLECLWVVDEGSLKESLRSKVGRMAQVLIDLTHPDGYVSLFNDGGLHMTYPPGECLKIWREITHEEIRPRKVFALEDSGYYGLRSSNEYVLVDCGKVAPDFLPAHGHGDIFSFEWTIAGKRFVIDAGVFEYNAGSRRKYARSTRAHNTLTLDRFDQCEFWGAFRMARRARVERRRYAAFEDGFTLTGSHDGYRRLPGCPVHTRSFIVKPGRIRVEDLVEGGQGQRAESRLLFHHDCQIEARDGVWYITRDDVVVRLVTDAGVHVEEALWFPDFGVERRSAQIVITYGAAPCRGSFSLERLVE